MGERTGKIKFFIKKRKKYFQIFEFYFGLSKISLLATLVSEGTIYMKILRKIIYWEHLLKHSSITR